VPLVLDRQRAADLLRRMPLVLDRGQSHACRSFLIGARGRDRRAVLGGEEGGFGIILHTARQTRAPRPETALRLCGKTCTGVTSENGGRDFVASLLGSEPPSG